MEEKLETFYSEELIKIFNYIRTDILHEFPCNKITPEHFMLSFLNNECTAATAISNVMVQDAVNVLKGWYHEYLSNNTDFCVNNPLEVKCDNRLHTAIVYAHDNYMINNTITTLSILKSLFATDDIISKTLRLLGVTDNQLPDIKQTSTSETVDTNNNSNKLPMTLKTNNLKVVKKGNSMSSITKFKNKNCNDEVEKNLRNLNTIAAKGKIDEVIGNDDVINNILTTLQKKYKNNVIIVGESGCGKTSTVKHIANMIINNKVPKAFLDKKLMQLDFMNLLNGTGFRGSFETKFNHIIDDAIKSGKYIFFIDDIHSILGDKTKLGEVDVETMLDSILMEKNIQFICTTNPKSYKTYIESNNSFKRRFQKITMDAPSVEKTIKILNQIKNKIERYHKVNFSNEIIDKCTNLSKRYITDNILPDSAINVLDKTGARISLFERDKDTESMKEIKRELLSIKKEKTRIDNSSYPDYNQYDELVKKEISLNSKLFILEKEKILNNSSYDVTEDDILLTISEMSGVQVKNINVDDFENLQNMNNNIKQTVIGQDEAVDVVCSAVKKQKLGISDPNKPVVFLFAGSTGTGKTLLAKKIAEEVFGDEKKMVRLDMSEYAEKTSVTKLYGSSAGYVGYDNGGILTEAIKKNKHCVLLLDEIEKADEEVHNVFLQLFDEGRLTDNTGDIVDFKNTIIIMTSNVGAKEISDKGKGIGFYQNNTNNKHVFEKALKKKFKPEFINRINKIIYFNQLNEANIKNIIKNELLKLEKRLNNAGYYLDSNFICDDVIDSILDKINYHQYGARSVVRQIESDIEDVITDFIIKNKINKNYTFTLKDIFG